MRSKSLDVDVVSAPKKKSSVFVRAKVLVAGLMVLGTLSGGCASTSTSNGDTTAYSTSRSSDLKRNLDDGLRLSAEYVYHMQKAEEYDLKAKEAAKREQGAAKREQEARASLSSHQNRLHSICRQAPKVLYEEERECSRGDENACNDFKDDYNDYQDVCVNELNYPPYKPKILKEFASR